uniref:Uncharacterized protein n=1 Tax=Amblyomma cajennense TaxID=34607 RepID=A0A023FDA1_AMBCJ
MQIDDLNNLLKCHSIIYFLILRLMILFVRGPVELEPRMVKTAEIFFSLPDLISMDAVVNFGCKKLVFFVCLFACLFVHRTVLAVVISICSLC